MTTQTYTFNIGGWQATALNEGGGSFDANTLFANAPADERKSALAQHGLTAEHIPIGLAPLLLKTEAQTILFDVGTGIMGQPDAGQMLTSLETTGVTSEQIEVILISHMHGDHIGGAIQEDGSATFANATFYVHKDEWAYWDNEENLLAYPEERATAIKQCLDVMRPSLELFEGEGELLPGISALPTPGHTVGHTAFEIVRDGETYFYTGDAFLHPIDVAHPTWHATFDADPERLAASRRLLFKRAANAKGVLIYHAPFPGLGTFAASGDGYTWQPREG